MTKKPDESQKNILQISAKLSETFHPSKSAGKKGGSKPKASQIKIRRRGTVLIETPEGILVVSEDGVRFSLPGGAAYRDEPRIQAAIRELREETSLAAYSVKYLFSHLGNIRKRGSAYSRNYHKVFLIEAEGIPEPRQEIKVVQFYKPGDPLKLSDSTLRILARYRLTSSN
jgi:8-oxo-dGTP diphosphatase